MANPHSTLLFLFSLLLCLCTTQSQSTVPVSQTFTYINEGEFGPYITEYGADYRLLDIATFPFQLCFYNTTPNAFYLALRMGHPRSESTLRWVWEANRNVPVRENATLTFGRDGNLVLADAGGRVVWSTGTANKGVVGLRLLSTGNLVLHDSRGRFVWQSFDHPTDTLLVGQSLRINGPNKLVSRTSNVNASEGPYSLVTESGGLAMYTKIGSNSLPYYNYSDGIFDVSGSLTSITFASSLVNGGFATELTLDIVTSSSPSGSFILARPKYNATLSFLRLGLDGNLKIYTYYDKVDYRAWEVAFAFFSIDGRLRECRLPGMCGSLGVCEDEMCVACPQPQGLLGWSKSCALPKVAAPCNNGPGVDYYKVEGVENFISAYVESNGRMKVGECREKCNQDCSCVGFLYWEESSQCWLAPVIGTLEKVSNPSHSVFIKFAK